MIFSYNKSTEKLYQKTCRNYQWVQQISRVQNWLWKVRIISYTSNKQKDNMLIFLFISVSKTYLEKNTKGGKDKNSGRKTLNLWGKRRLPFLLSVTHIWQKECKKGIYVGLISEDTVSCQGKSARHVITSSPLLGDRERETKAILGWLYILGSIFLTYFLYIYIHVTITKKIKEREATNWEGAGRIQIWKNWRKE